MEMDIDSRWGGYRELSKKSGTDSGLSSHFYLDSSCFEVATKEVA